MGWTLLGKAWRSGADTGETKRLMLDQAFKFVGRVILRIGGHNIRSRRAAEKIGARLTDRTDVTNTGGVMTTPRFYAIEPDKIAG